MADRCGDRRFTPKRKCRRPGTAQFRAYESSLLRSPLLSAQDPLSLRGIDERAEFRATLPRPPGVSGTVVGTDKGHVPGWEWAPATQRKARYA